MRLILLLFFITTSLFSALQDKSAMVYYGEDISYPMVGIHDYIIVQPKSINTYSHGFDIYKDKMYAYISIGEIDKTTTAYKKVKKEWVIANNEAWSSEVLDLKNREYINFLFTQMIEPQMKRGFKNFFFDTLDSYQLASKNLKERRENEQALVAFIMEFHKRYKDSKIILNRGFEIIDKVHSAVEAVLFESYYKGIGGKKLAYRDVSDGDREWLDIYLKKIRSYSLPIISVEYLAPSKMKKAPEVAKKISEKGMIPYVTNRELDSYGYSSKNAIKREVFTLVDEKRLDRTFLESHQRGATILEYMGYVQKLHDIQKGLPKIEKMRHYAGVLIWLRDYYNNPQKLIKWVKALKKESIKVAFVSNFGVNPEGKYLKQLGIKVTNKRKIKRKILTKDEMMGFEIEPSLATSGLQIESKNKKALLVYEYMDGTTSTPAALTSWGGYAIGDVFMVGMNTDNIWTINPFKFFQESLGLKELIVPDVTTENGRRLLFTHVDGDGMMNRVEGDFGYYSGDVILNKILKVYKIPHSVSVIGAEISDQGLYPKIAPELRKIAKAMYALENVEPATHTFTHPFFWDKIVNDNLDEAYRLKPKGYKFSLENEINGQLQYINKELHPKHKAKTVFWSGDCIPRENALSLIAKEHILNINGGDTVITATSPWLSGIAPLGIQRGVYTQVYTGAQNENIFTNNWLGPFWGFKRVVQTFKLTNTPRRFKPIDIYYHLYSGSKEASLRALTYVFDWAIKQDVMPIFTSEYIPKVKDFYTVSMANEESVWLFDGMRSIRTLRIEQEDVGVALSKSSSIVGVQDFERHTYLSLDTSSRHLIVLSNDLSYKNTPFLISANAQLKEYEHNATTSSFGFSGYVDLDIVFNVPKNCKLSAIPQADEINKIEGEESLKYKGKKEAVVFINCQ